MNRHTRYQGAIIRNHSILLIKQRVFPTEQTERTVWLFPGGGIETGETEEECVKREMKEETNLDVQIISLLLDEPAGLEARPYLQIRTFLCKPMSRNASPGHELEHRPEVDPTGSHNPLISEVKWFDLHNESNWDPALVNDPIIYLPLQRVRRKLGYLP